MRTRPPPARSPPRLPQNARIAMHHGSMADASAATAPCDRAAAQSGARDDGDGHPGRTSNGKDLQEVQGGRPAWSAALQSNCGCGTAGDGGGGGAAGWRASGGGGLQDGKQLAGTGCVTAEGCLGVTFGVSRGSGGAKDAAACACVSRPSVHASMRVHACLPACLPAYLPVCLPACIHACLPACMHACMHPCVPACMPAYIHACLPACLPASMRACLHACLPACMSLVSPPNLYQTATVVATVSNFSSLHPLTCRVLAPLLPGLAPWHRPGR
eukprot:83259-Chlamydomonas_euryale.AAC.7